MRGHRPGHLPQLGLGVERRRHVVDSYVGWPVDMVARKVVQKPVLVGRDALDNRSMLDLRRPLERGVIREGSDRDEEAVGELLHHLTGLVGLKQNGKNWAQVRAVVGVPAATYRVSRQRLRSALDGLADSIMLVSEPFAVAYGLEALLHSMIIDIGAGTADLCIMQGRYPSEEDQRTLTDAGDAIDDRLGTTLRERYPDAQFSIHMIREWKERWSFVGEPKHRAVVSVPMKGKATELDITDEMRAACESIVPAICETMMDLLARVEPEYQRKVRNNVILAGGSFAHSRPARLCRPRALGAGRRPLHRRERSDLRGVGRRPCDRVRRDQRGLGEAVALTTV